MDNNWLILWGYCQVNSHVIFVIPLSKIFALTTSVDQATNELHTESVGYLNLNTSGFNWYGTFADTNTEQNVKGYWLLIAA